MSQLYDEPEFLASNPQFLRVLELDLYDLRTLPTDVCPFLGCGVKGAGPLRLMYRRWYTTSK